MGSLEGVAQMRSSAVSVAKFEDGGGNRFTQSRVDVQHVELPGLPEL